MTIVAMASRHGVAANFSPRGHRRDRPIVKFFVEIWSTPPVALH
jgi:hypothetical protein